MSYPPFNLVWPQGLINDQVIHPSDLMQLDENLKTVGDLLVTNIELNVRTLLNSVSEPLGEETTIDQVLWDPRRNGWLIYNALGDFNAVEWLWGPGTVALNNGGDQPPTPTGGIQSGNIAASDQGLILLGHEAGSADDTNRLVRSTDGGATFANVTGLASQINRPRVLWTGAGDDFIVFDGADSWKYDGSALSAGGALAGTLDPGAYGIAAARNGTILIGSSNPSAFIFLSDDLGTTWQQSSPGAAGLEYVRSLAWFDRLGKWIATGPHDGSSDPTRIATSEDGLTWDDHAPVFHGYGNETGNGGMTDIVPVMNGSALVANVHLGPDGNISGEMLFYTFDAVDWYPIYLENSRAVKQLASGPFGVAMLFTDNTLRILGS